MIVFFLPDVVGGVSSVISNILEYAPDQKDLYAIAYSDTRIRRETIDPVKSAGGFCRFVYHGYDNNFFTSKRLFRETPHDLTCIVATDALELRMVQCLRLDKPLIYIILGDFKHYYDLAVLNEGIIDSFIAISKEIETRLLRLIPHRRDDIHLAYSPTPAVTIKRQRSDAASLRIIYVARLEEGKNPLLLPRIDALLKTKDIRVDWTIVGDGPLRKELETAIGKAKNFRLTGFLSITELSRLYADHDIFLLPSLHEGLPVSLIEAMKTGLTPIVSDIPGGIREVITQETNGLLCPPSDEQAFAAGVERLYRDRDILEKLSANALHFADETFDPVTCGNTWWSIIRATLSSTPGHKNYTVLKNGILDREWLPNGVVRLLRKIQYRNSLKSE